MTKDEELEQLRQEHTALRDHVARLSERISVLEAQLAKASHNSHLFLLGSLSSAAKHLRKKSGKQPGAVRSCRNHPEAMGDARSGDRSRG